MLTCAPAFPSLKFLDIYIGYSGHMHLCTQTCQRGYNIEYNTANSIIYRFVLHVETKVEHYKAGQKVYVV